MGRQVKRRRIPVAALRMLAPVVRPFDELSARLMTLGLYAATKTTAFPQWTVASERFAVQPRTVEAYLANHPSI